ncbi:MAG: XdhC family protein [Bacteroidota bacterium]
MKEIRQILGLYDQLKADATPCALAVVVSVAGSSYRRIGARLLVATDGRYVGGISGGCLEGDALRRARRAILSAEPTVHVYDTLDGEDAVIGIGLGCNGRIEILFVPLNFNDPDNELEVLRRLTDIRTSRVICRVLQHPSGPSARVFTAEYFGALAQVLGTDQAAIRDTAVRVRTEGRSQVIVHENPVAATVLYEILRPEIHLIVTGTNYDIPPTLAAARHLGWRTTVVGPKRKFTTTLSNLADRLVDYGEVRQLSVDAATAVALMSHDYEWDKRMVQHFLPLDPPYFGMLGPRKRVVKMDEELPDFGLQDYPNLYAPVGLDIGAETPEEIAASLVAEILMVFRERDGRALRERTTSIH